MKTIDLSDAQIKSLSAILSQSMFHSTESTVHEILFRLNSFTDGHNFKFSVPAPKPMAPAAPMAPQQHIRAEPAPFDDLKALRIAEAIAGHGEALIELRRDRNGEGRPAMSADTYVNTLFKMRRDLRVRIWEIVNDCIGYTVDRETESYILERANREPFVMELRGANEQRLIQKLLSEGKLIVANVQTDPKETTVKKA